jgi:hypothetical protein
MTHQQFLTAMTMALRLGDEPYFRHLARELLEQHGIKTAGVNDG